MHLLQKFNDLHWCVNFKVVKFVLECQPDLELLQILGCGQTWTFVLTCFDVVYLGLVLVSLLVWEKWVRDRVEENDNFVGILVVLALGTRHETFQMLHQSVQALVLIGIDESLAVEIDQAELIGKTVLKMGLNRRLSSLYMALILLWWVGIALLHSYTLLVGAL